MDKRRCGTAVSREFFPEQGGNAQLAKKICSECVVVDICLETALQNKERFGVYDGKTERERRQILVQRMPYAHTRPAAQVVELRPRIDQEEAA